MPNMLDAFTGNLRSMDMATLLGNLQFLGTVYNWKVLLVGFLFLSLLDLCLRAVALWRAAKMGRTGWFVVLLLSHSFGILPLLFLQMTAKTYRAQEKAATLVSHA